MNKAFLFLFIFFYYFSNFFETKKHSRGFDVKLNQITQDKSEEIE